MRTFKTFTEPGLITEVNNFKNATVVVFSDTNNRRRTYKKPVKRRMSTNQFNKFSNDLKSYDFINDRFKFLKKKGYKKF